MLEEILGDLRPKHFEFRTSSTVPLMSGDIPTDDPRILGIGLRATKFKR